jgi:hypothetical protein
MTHTALILSIALVLGSTVASAADATPSDPCGLFTKDEIATSMGRSDFGKGKLKSAETGAACRYASSRGSLNVWVGPSTPKDFAAFRDLLATEGKKPESVAGVGDEAYFWDERIYVRAGSRGLTIWLGAPGGEAARKAVLALAKVGAGKLR